MKLLYESERLGGLFLMLGAASLLFIIVEYILLSAGAPGLDNLPERAAYFLERYPSFARGWHFEVVAMALVGAGALVRLDGPAKAGWALVAIGVAGVLPMYPLMIGGYVPALEAAQDDVLAYKIVNEIAWEIFVVGNMILNLGLALAFWLECGASLQRPPRWLMWIGFGANLIAGLGMLAMHAGLPVQISVAGSFALVGFLVLAVFGAFQAFKREPNPK
ncbi:MAG: hypothetical protein AAGB23_10405 [Pseudomonadota bacterium]